MTTRPKPTRLVAVADLHGNLPTEMPEGDVLAIVGDSFPTSDHTPRGQAAWVKQRLTPYLRDLPYDDIFVVAGNHDFIFAMPTTSATRPSEPAALSSTARPGRRSSTTGRSCFPKRI